MARHKKQLSNAFVGFSKKEENQNEQVNENVKQNNETENVNNEGVHTQEIKQENVTVISNTEHITKDVTQSESILSVEQVKNDLLNMYQEKSKKETMEDTHTRATFLFRKDLAKRLDKLAKNKRGFKTLFMNKAIEALLDEMEK
jgi:predicted DNA-binding protein